MAAAALRGRSVRLFVDDSDNPKIEMIACKQGCMLIEALSNCCKTNISIRRFFGTAEKQAETESLRKCAGIRLLVMNRIGFGRISVLPIWVYPIF